MRVENADKSGWRRTSLKSNVVSDTCSYAEGKRDIQPRVAVQLEIRTCPDERVQERDDVRRKELAGSILASFRILDRSVFFIGAARE